MKINGKLRVWFNKFYWNILCYEDRFFEHNWQYMIIKNLFEILINQQII